MTYNPNQTRGADGKWGAGGHASDQAVRNAGRYPVAPHDGRRSMATHAGYSVSTLDEKSGKYQPVAGGRRRAVAETIARSLRIAGAQARVK